MISETTPAGETPEVLDVDRPSIGDLNALPSVKTNACIYCGSTEGLTREHAIPFALGGTLTIVSGSCKECREITAAFETDVLKHQLGMVRYIQAIPSRNKHKDTPKEVPVVVVRDGKTEEEILLPIDQAPILVPFPEFGPPRFFNQDGEAKLQLVGATTGSFGRPPLEVAKALGPGEVTIKPPGVRPTSFARVLAKIAFCQAYATGVLDWVEDVKPLVNAFMHEPDRIGRFVGSKDPPFERFENMSVRVAIKQNEQAGILFAEVQLFASSGAPTYLVVIGRLRQ